MVPPNVGGLPPDLNKADSGGGLAPTAVGGLPPDLNKPEIWRSRIPTAFDVWECLPPPTGFGGSPPTGHPPTLFCSHRSNVGGLPPVPSNIRWEPSNNWGSMNKIYNHASCTELRRFLKLVPCILVISRVQTKYVGSYSEFDTISVALCQCIFLPLKVKYFQKFYLCWNLKLG